MRHRGNSMAQLRRLGSRLIAIQTENLAIRGCFTARTTDGMGFPCAWPFLASIRPYQIPIASPGGVLVRLPHALASPACPSPRQRNITQGKCHVAPPFLHIM